LPKGKGMDTRRKMRERMGVNYLRKREKRGGSDFSDFERWFVYRPGVTRRQEDHLL